jgi:hypothetical protein
LVNGVDGRAHTLKFECDTPYTTLEKEVRKKVNDINTALDLSYTTSWANKSLKRALEGEEHWQELMTLALANHRKVKEGYHARLYHFLDNKAKAKTGKAANKSQQNVSRYFPIVATPHYYSS